MVFLPVELYTVKSADIATVALVTLNVSKLPFSESNRRWGYLEDRKSMTEGMVKTCPCVCGCVCKCLCVGV